jgi:hypothetical protein
MKIRNGFVSNSSSSSFLLVTTKMNYDKVLESLSENEKELLKKCNYLFGRKKAFGQELITISYINGEYSSFEDLPKGSADLIQETIIPALRVDSDNCFTHSEDF